MPLATVASFELGRGITNLMEPLRMGEFGRSYEQTYLWDGPEAAYSEGIVRGVNRTIGRAVVQAISPERVGQIFEVRALLEREGFAPDALTTFAQRSISCARNRAKYSGDSSTGSAPNCASL